MIIKTLKKLKASAVNCLKFFADQTLSLFRFKLLTPAKTIFVLKEHKVAAYASPRINLPQTVVYQPEKTIVKTGIVEQQIGFVWLINVAEISAKQFKSGTIKLDDKVLCTDHNHMGFYRAIINLKKRPQVFVKTLIAPFSQFCDGLYYGGYYDFVFLVFAKLCRIKEALPAAEFANATVAYPLFKTAYEAEYLSLLGINQKFIVDSNVCEVKFSNVILASNSHWFYPSIADIQAVKKVVNGNLQISRSAKKRIYISRNARRKIVNEIPLIALLKEFGFTIIEDEYLTIAQQIEIYKNASFIIGPHGASFSNIIWCDPGTQLFELFSPNYKPDFFRYLAAVTKMEYTSYFHGKPGNVFLKTAISEDIYVSVPEIKTCLSAIFQTEIIIKPAKNLSL